jgi:hypothetical protein
MSQTHGRNATSVSEIRIVRYRLLLAALLGLGLAVPASAGPFRRAPKPDPVVQVPALLETLKNDKDERARARAAAALDEFDGKAFPDILPALSAALASDPSPSVREDAALAIGKIRPITPQAGYALEQALATDKSIQVRLSVRRSLFQYRILGYFGGSRDLTAQSSEPPLASGTPTGPGSTVLRPTPTPAPFSPTQRVPAPTPAGPKPTPAQSTEPPVAPDAPTKLVEVPAPASTPSTGPGVLTGLPKPVPIDGPALGPPK